MNAINFFKTGSHHKIASPEKSGQTILFQGANQNISVQGYYNPIIGKHI